MSVLGVGFVLRPLGQPERATFGSFGTQMARTYSIDPSSRLLEATT